MAAFDLISLTSVASSTALLAVLKDAKNSLIGNTWKKVEVAHDEEALQFFLSHLELPSNADASPETLDIIVEIAVIFGALANVGTLTLRPLLTSHAPIQLLHSIRNICGSTTISPLDRSRLLSAVLRALRNVLVSAADSIWGHVWGVSVHRRQVHTGLIREGEEGATERERRDKETAKRDTRNASGASISAVLSAVFEREYLDTLLSLLEHTSSVHILLPLYQLLTRLIALPSHRDALVQWTPPATFSPASSTSSRPSASLSYRSTKSSEKPTPYILVHILQTISPASVDSTIGLIGATRRNPKLLEAALSFLAALVNGEEELAKVVREWPSTRPANEMDLRGEDEGDSGVMCDLLGLLKASPPAVRIAAASCLTNLNKAEAGGSGVVAEEGSVRRGAVNRNVLDTVVLLLNGEVMEERIKLCFVLADLVRDDPLLQKAAAERGCPAQLLSLYLKLDEEEYRGEIGADPCSRARELTTLAYLLALASMALQTESTRSLIAEYSPAFLPHLLQALRHPSYGVRAAGCHLARALSRCIAVLRTSLIDSGVAEEIVELLRRECSATEAGAEGRFEAGKVIMNGDLSSSEGRGWAVEIAAMGTICNLVPDFSPLRAKLLGNGGVALLVSLTRSPHEPLAVNALWAIKNLTFRATEGAKSAVMAELGYEPLKLLMLPYVSNDIRAQAFGILRNLTADETPAELSRTTDAFAEGQMLDLIQAAAKDRDLEIRAAAISTLANLALGNERMRQALVARIEIVEGLSDALNSKSDSVKHAALRTLRHLFEASTRSRRPRQAMLELFHPYQLKPRLVELTESAVGFDVRHAAGGLLDVLERGRTEGTGAGSRA